MSKKSHLSWHDIELYLEEKIDKRVLREKKDHYIREFVELKEDCDSYLKNEDEQLYEAEWEMYHERLEKNEEILKGLKMIFPEDIELDLLIEDI